MVLFAHHTGRTRLERSLPRRGPQHRRQCLQLGSLFSLVRPHPPKCLSLLTIHLGSYNMLKKRASGDDPSFHMSPGAYLLCSAQASSPLVFLWPRTCPDVHDRCRDCYHDQSNMGRQSAHVHHACRRPQVLQGALACVLPLCLHHMPLRRLHHRRPLVHIQHRGHTRSLEGHVACTRRCQQWRNTIHGLRRNEAMGL